MVRMRCRIAEDEEPASALEAARRRSRSTSSTRTSGLFVEPRLAHLLGLAEHQARDQQDLFAAWRLFFERLADELPDGARLRGHAVGRREPARLRRVPARLVAELTRSSWSRSRGRSCSSAGRPGAPANAASRRSTSSRSRSRPWRSCSPVSCRACRPGARPHPRSCRGHPALRGRDRADAARPRPARPGRARCTD